MTLIEALNDSRIFPGEISQFSVQLQLRYGVVIKTHSFE